MKKILSLCVLTVMLAFSVEGQTKELTAANAIESVAGTTSGAISQVYSDGTAIVKEAYDVTKTLAPKIESALESIGKSLKVGAGNVWDILVKQQLVYSICTLIALLMTIISWLHFWKRYDTWKTDTENKHIMGCFIAFVIAISGTILVGLHFTGMITGFINPEFGALKTISDIASQLK